MFFSLLQFIKYVCLTLHYYNDAYIITLYSSISIYEERNWEVENGFHEASNKPRQFIFPCGPNWAWSFGAQLADVRYGKTESWWKPSSFEAWFQKLMRLEWCEKNFPHAHSLSLFREIGQIYCHIITTRFEERSYCHNSSTVNFHHWSGVCLGLEFMTIGKTCFSHV